MTTLDMPRSVRARDLGIPFDGQPGPLNAITDVAGVRVGHRTIISPPGGDGVRTGVTALFPFESFDGSGALAGLFAFNGTGELTGGLSIQEFGAMFGPVVLTGTTSVGVARDAVIDWVRRRTGDPEVAFAHILPVVAETFEGDLCAPWVFGVDAEDVHAALDAARGGPVDEGGVGGGTAAIAYDFKGGIGTASRRFVFGEQTYTVGALVQSNHGDRHALTIAGKNVGRAMPDGLPAIGGAPTPTRDGSIVVVLATDAPLLPHQLTRMAKRATIGLARTGGIGTSTSGDLFLAFTTANRIGFSAGALQHFSAMPNEQLNELFYATADATEEAIVNCLVAAKDATSEAGLVVRAIGHERLRALFA